LDFRLIWTVAISLKDPKMTLSNVTLQAPPPLPAPKPETDPAFSIPSLLVSVPEAARLLGISIPTTNRMLRKRTITRRKMGGRTLISRAELEAFANPTRH
jgi:excisionase family DNA binding protein